jgi:hypothetical protein
MELRLMRLRGNGFGFLIAFLSVSFIIWFQMNRSLGIMKNSAVAGREAFCLFVQFVGSTMSARIQGKTAIWMTSTLLPNEHT